MLSCKSLLTGRLWRMKSQSCSCMPTSKAEPGVSGCFGDNNRRFVCGLHTAEDNVGWQVCADQTLHRQPAALACFCLSELPVHLGPLAPPHLHLQGVCGRSRLRPLRAFVSGLLCEVRLELGSLCPSPHWGIYSLALGGGGRAKQSMDRPQIVSPRNKAKCKQGEAIFKRQRLN